MLSHKAKEGYHMAAQPIYPNELNLALDRLYMRVAGYIDARNDILTTQMRVDRQEALTRDNDLRSGMKNLADAILTLTQRVNGVETRIEGVETTQHTMMETFKGFATDISKQMADGFARQEERTNEILMRLAKLEQRDTPPQG